MTYPTRSLSLGPRALLAALTVSTGCFSPSDPSADTEPATDAATDGATSGNATGDDGGVETGNTGTGSAPGDGTAGPGDDTDPATTDGDADSGPGDDATTTDDDGSTTEPDVAPTIVDVAPADGATAVFADQPVVVTFSEPMDTASVEAALDVTAFGPVTFGWNGDATELTIDPAALPLAAGTSPATVVALELSWSIAGDATDAQGTALGTDFAASFSTARAITTSFARDQAYTGAVYSDGTLHSGSGGDPTVGDNSANVGRRAFMGFDIGSLPVGILAIDHAQVSAEQWLSTQSMIPEFGAAMTIHRIAATVLPSTAYGAASLEDLGVWTDEDGSGAGHTKTKEVTPAVQLAYDGGATRVQFRLQLPTATDADGTIDYIRYDDELLEVTYLLE